MLPGAAVNLTISIQPANVGGNVDSALSTQPVIAVTDQYLNNVAGGTVVTAVSGGTGGGSPVGSTTATTTGGSAHFLRIEIQ